MICLIWVLGHGKTILNAYEQGRQKPIFLSTLEARVRIENKRISGGDVTGASKIEEMGRRGGIPRENNLIT